MGGQEDALMRKVIWRIVPLIFALFVLNSIDRVNVSFAALQMNHELGFSPRVYGFGVGMFFFSYLLFQIPVTQLARRYGARPCLGFMTIAWGIAASAMAFVHTATEFYVLRFVLGLTEAGFAPVSLYLYSQWIPGRYRARVTSKNTIAIAVSILIGAPLSGWLMTGPSTLFAMSGWRWMFFAEGIVPILLGVFTLFYLPDSPHKTSWLSQDEADELTRAVNTDTRSHGAVDRVATLPDIARSPRVWACAGAWFALTMGVYGVIFWLPQAIKGMSNLNDFNVAVLSAVPWIAAAFGMWFNARHSDRHAERTMHVVLPAALGAIALAASASIGTMTLSYLALMLALLGLGAAQAVFWAIPMSALQGPAAAAGFAFINLFGNLAGLVGPNVIGWIRQETGSFADVAYFLALVLLAGACLLFVSFGTRKTPLAPQDR